MNYGVYTSKGLEIAQTKFWTLCFYCKFNKSIIGAELYNGVDDSKTLAAVCERNNQENKTVYAYETPDGQVFTNENDGIRRLIGKRYQYDTNELKSIDTIEISEPYTLPTVSGAGIENCLKQWRMGTFYNMIYNGMNFQMVTNKIEYVFMIQNDNCNIYCGASVNIPYDKGMFGSGQYFRIRNFADNEKPFCRFECNLGNMISIPNVPEYVCESGKCTTTSKGLYWPVKRYSDDEIVLDGCDGDEYIYNRDKPKSEYFTISVI